MTTSPGRNLRSIRAAASRADCSEKTIRRYVAQGKLTGYRFGPRILRVDMDEVDALLQQIPTAAGGDDTPLAS
jgi:excisionase family DNA binding protein